MVGLGWLESVGDQYFYLVRDCGEPLKLPESIMKPNITCQPFLSLILFIAATAVAVGETMLVRNGDFGGRGGGPVKPETVAQFRKQGLTCPDAKDWPTSWGYLGAGGTFEFPATGGVNADSFARINGKDAWLTGYHALPWEGNQVYSAWARGKGKLTMHVISYGTDAAGKPYQLTDAAGAILSMTVSVVSPKWVQYRHLMKKTAKLTGVQPLLNTPEGIMDVDMVNIVPSTPALDLIVAEEEKLYGTGALIENLDFAQADDIFQKKQEDYRIAMKEFQAVSCKLDTMLVESMKEATAALEPYVLTRGLTMVQVSYYNEMIVLTRVLNGLAGKKADTLAAIKATEVVLAKIDYTPGVRPLTKDTVMVTGIEPNKILYEEGEEAAAQVKLKNTTGTQQQVSLTALLYADLDPAREVARGNLSITAGGENTWTIRFNVGPATYGRALEVVVTDAAGKELDRWQEYYQVAKEWLRVQMHSGSRYMNMNHYFESEPTDWGVQPTDAEMWKSSAGYEVNPAVRRDQMRLGHSKGKKFTFYQNPSFCGIMGYEEMRKHPEYVLFDANGQFAVDPTYGVYPNPMELASPIEIGPRRAPKKSWLDRPYISWQHAAANLAREELIEYEARSIREYAKRYEFDGVFIDGTISAFKGYGYDGKINLPADQNEIAKVNARIQNLYCRILKEENPNFGTWYNFSPTSIEWVKSAHGADSLTGSGFSPGESDEWIRAMNSWKNVACLMESVGAFGQDDYADRRPAGFLAMLCRNRDYTVQKYGGNTIIGYFQGVEALSTNRAPGPAKWGWPTINYFLAQIIATQHHIVLCVAGSSPSMEPAFQFQTRYSSLLWAPDIKLVPAAEMTVTVKTPEALFWKQLVYRRETKDGYDLIVHLVRIPPYAKWDLTWVDEPAPLAGVELALTVGRGTVTAAYACRPYQFEEPQQVVHQELTTNFSDGIATVSIPLFRYHTMVVMRVSSVNDGGKQ